MAAQDKPTLEFEYSCDDEWLTTKPSREKKVRSDESPFEEEDTVSERSVKRNHVTRSATRSITKVKEIAKKLSSS